MTAPPRSDRDFDALVEHAFVDEECLRAAWHAAGRLAGEIEAIERSAASPREALPALCAALGRAGLLGLVARAEDGGRFAAIRSVALCLARERLAWISPLADLAFAMQALGGYPIGWRGSAALRRRWLPRV
ncbi:MAG: acyl-CoA dehydrogenase family protein, partial [Myxococcota bacterium]|nr:acyl-CoA dehydrogenase family protein [Myxococcota bacterium]